MVKAPGLGAKYARSSTSSSARRVRRNKAAAAKAAATKATARDIFTVLPAGAARASERRGLLMKPLRRAEEVVR